MAPGITIQELTNLIIEDGIITPAENSFFVEFIHRDGIIDTDEKQAVIRLYDLIQSGHLKIVDN